MNTSFYYNILLILTLLWFCLFLFYVWKTFYNNKKNKDKKPIGIPKKKYGNILVPIYSKPNTKIVYWFSNFPNKNFLSKTDKSGLAFIQLHYKEQKKYLQYKFI